jgi:hypothetical protein
MALTDQELDRIRSRWTAAALIANGWGRLPEGRRELVLSELEEAARESHNKELASDLGAAVDALDLMGRTASLDLVAHAVSDVRALLLALDEMKK